MPASLFPEMERSGGSLEDQRALQLALELSMLGLNNENDSLGSTFDTDARSKKSQNTTECVPVPSSEHVAEIVGRQGCKIKALRAKTNTYIKTPVRGEEPVFVVTGRKEDVNAAKREILSAAEHFSQIRAQRKNNLNGSLAPGPNSNIPGQTTIQVRVPYRVVGLVVGPKGATIKRIQQQTNTYIVTPSRDKEPVFEVTGLPENVEIARKEIEAHIAMRTGGIIDSGDENDFHTNGVEQAYTGNTGSGYVHSMYKSEINGGGFTPYQRDSNNILTPRSQEHVFNFPPTSTNGSAKLTDIYNSTTAYNGSFTNGYTLYDTDEGLGESPTFESALVPPPQSSLWPDFGNPRTTATIFGNTSTSTSLSRRSSSLSSAGSGMAPSLTDPLLLDHPPARRIQSDPLTNGLPTFTSLANGSASGTNGVLINGFPTSSSGGSGSTASSPTDSLGSGKRVKRDCVVCFESEVVAALVPCGHNMFCMECANRICEKTEPTCPVCTQQASQAIRIYS